MGLKQKMVDMAIEATGDDEIFVAGDFQPKGMTWKRAAGAAAGSVVGGAAGDGNSWARAAGTMGGMAVGTLAASGKGVPPVVVLAASPTKLYVLATSMGQSTLLAKHLEVLNVMDRENLAVTIRKRAMTRTAVIEDESNGGKIELEGLKLGFHHMNDLLDLLDDQEELEAETLARLEDAETGGAEPTPA